MNICIAIICLLMTGTSARAGESDRKSESSTFFSSRLFSSTNFSTAGTLRYFIHRTCSNFIHFSGKFDTQHILYTNGQSKTSHDLTNEPNFYVSGKKLYRTSYTEIPWLCISNVGNQETSIFNITSCDKSFFTIEPMYDVCGVGICLQSESPPHNKMYILNNLGTALLGGYYYMKESSNQQKQFFQCIFTQNKMRDCGKKRFNPPIDQYIILSRPAVFARYLKQRSTPHPSQSLDQSSVSTTDNSDTSSSSSSSTLSSSSSSSTSLSLAITDAQNLVSEAIGFLASSSSSSSSSESADVMNPSSSSSVSLLSSDTPPSSSSSVSSSASSSLISSSASIPETTNSSPSSSSSTCNSTFTSSTDYLSSSSSSPSSSSASPSSLSPCSSASGDLLADEQESSWFWLEVHLNKKTGNAECVDDDDNKDTH